MIANLTINNHFDCFLFSELLDSGALKKALAEVEKLLRKTSKYTLAKACKALALIRMGKRDEPRFILEQVMKEKEHEAWAVGDLSHILLLCYRELHERTFKKLKYN